MDEDEKHQHLLSKRVLQQSYTEQLEDGAKRARRRTALTTNIKIGNHFKRRNLQRCSGTGLVELNNKQKSKLNQIWARRLLTVVDKEVRRHRRMRDTCDVCNAKELKALAKKMEFKCCLLGHKLNLYDAGRFSYVYFDHIIPLGLVKHIKEVSASATFDLCVKL